MRYQMNAFLDILSTYNPFINGPPCKYSRQGYRHLIRGVKYDHHSHCAIFCLHITNYTF